MNENMETILRKAPRAKAPAGLLEKLQADIVLPRAPVNEAESTDPRPFFRRWLPALSFSAFLLASLIAIAVQANILSDLRQENRQLQSSAAEIEQARLASAGSQAGQAEQLRLEQLRKDAAEVERLRDEIAQLRAQGQEIATLRAENQRLKAAFQASANQAGVASEEDPLGAAQEKAKSAHCVNNLKQFGLAARLWANDNKDTLPPDVLSMTNELSTPKILVCPSDTGRTKAASWSEFGAANLSYEFLAPGISETETPYTIIARCPIHGHVGLLDGSVQGGAWKNAVQKNGRWILERNASRQ
jgi:hypothetical protein